MNSLRREPFLRDERRNPMKRKKILTIILSLGLALSILPVNTSKRTVCKAAEKESNYVVMAGNKEDLDEAREICQDEFQAEEVKTISSLREDYSNNYTVCKLSKTEAAELAIKDNVIVEKDDIISACTSAGDEGTDSDTEWNIKMVRAEEETNPESGNKKIKVAVLDSGVDDFNDLELAGSIDLIPGEEEVLPLFWDVTGHGSSVAGIIAAEKNDVGITGIAPETEIYAAKVLDDKNQAPVSRVIDGIYWAIDKNVNIINMSFGLKNNSAALHKAIKDAYNAGILLVAAAGNGDDVEYPAAYEEVIAVGSVDTSGTVSEKSASGDELELAAPGEQICSTGAFEGTLISAGTSMAAPHVTGIAARLWAKDTSVSAEFIRQLMAASANECGEKDSYGYGLVDLAYAEEIYDTFKENYIEGAALESNSDSIPENEADINGYEVDYAKGSWVGDVHQSAIDSSIITSAENQKVLKAGIIFPDKEKSGLKRKTLHPGWHGWFKREVSGWETVDGDNKQPDPVPWNYIQCYMLETRIANKLGEGSTITSSDLPKGMSFDIADELAGDVSKIDFSKWIKSDLGIDVTSKTKKLFVWGMALHNATDTFAHSTCGLIDGTWTFLTDESPNEEADNVNTCPGRKQTALLVAKSGLKHYKAGASGTATDFNPDGGYSQTKQKWKVKYLKKYADAVNTSVGTALKPYSYLSINSDGTLKLDS